MVQTVMAWFCHQRHWCLSSAYFSTKKKIWSFSVILLKYYIAKHFTFYNCIGVREHGDWIRYCRYVDIFVLKWLNVYCLPHCIWLMISVMNVKGYSQLNKLSNNVRCVIACVTQIDCVWVKPTMWEPTRKY